MKCEYEEYINRLLDGKLNEGEIEELKKHAEKCETCSKELKKIDKIDELIKDNLITYPYKSNKNKILSEVKKYDTNKQGMASIIYRAIKPVCAIAAILILSVGIYHYTSSNKSIQNNTKTELANKIIDQTYYINIKPSNMTNPKIDKLYPSYLPSGMELSHRDVLDGVDMQFDYLKLKDDVRSIEISIRSKQPTWWEEKMQGKPIQNSSGEWLLSIETRGYSLGKLCFKLNNLYVTIQTNNIPKDEIIKVANSIKETNQKLRVENKISDQTYYINIKPNNMTNAKIDKLYPSYIPSGMRLCNRDVVDGVYTQFSYLKSKGDVRTLGINIASKQQPTCWEEKMQGKPIQNSSGEWLLSIETGGYSYSVGKLCFKLNNLYVTIQTNNIPKDEIIKVANSIKETNKYLSNDVDDQTTLK